MVVDGDRLLTPRRGYALDERTRKIAHSDERGVPLAGRRAEIAALRSTGACNVSLGRIFEGHLNGAQLVARWGSTEQRAFAARAIDAGRLFGVWNTQDDAPVRITTCSPGYMLSGAKSWASGAGSIDFPLVTAAFADGASQMCLVPMDEVEATIDASAWRPLGMTASDSFTVGFDGVSLSREQLVGAPGDYERQPWFWAGALRFAAVQTGAIDRLTSETIAYLRKRGRTDDPFQTARVAEMCILRDTAGMWLDAGRRAWERFDADPGERRCAETIEAVDAARTVVERAALDTIERAVRSVGARGLIDPEPFGALVRDLEMYLRQPAPDAALLRVGRAAFRGAPL